MDLILVVIPASFRTIVTDVEDTALVITNFNVLSGKHPPPPPPPPPPPTGLEDNAAPPAPLQNEEPMLQQAAALGIVPITTEEDIVTQNLNNRISLISKYLSIYLEISVQNYFFRNLSDRNFFHKSVSSPISLQISFVKSLFGKGLEETDVGKRDTRRGGEGGD
jgi:hypothetical protein